MLNTDVYNQLDFDETKESEFAVKGLIDAPDALEIKDEDGHVIWSQKAYAFIEKNEKAPDTVNPSLWENTKNNYAYGLFEVVDGIYQVRGYDMANLMVIEGDTGWIVFDTLISVECSKAAMELVEKNLGKRDVQAVVISHSHVDHFGGIKGIITQEEVADRTLPLSEQIASGKIPVIVLEHFMEHAVSEKYMGWYDANPVHLNPLAPSESAKKWIEYLGDVDKVLEMAKKDFENGEYQWVAEITNVIVFADPENKDARYLCADALEQLGYQAESGTWRNAYLSAAKELREGNSAGRGKAATYDGDMQKNMTASMLFDYISIVLDKQKLADEDFVVNFKLTDVAENYTVHFKFGVMLVYENKLSDNADMMLTCPRNALFLILQRNYDGIKKFIQVEGNTKYLDLITDNLTEFDVSMPAKFNIVEP